MMTEMKTKAEKAMDSEAKVYAEYKEWVSDRTQELGFEIKTGKAGVTDLTAAIEKETATAASLNAKIEELNSS